MPYRSIDSAEAILDEVERLGFYPFFKNEIPGFSIGEHTPPRLWFSDTEEGPWEWKGPAVRTGRVLYGKFFKGRAGYISRDWYPVFANYRRNGYDFDALYDDGFAPYRDQAIYDVLAEKGSLLSRDLKQLCGYGKEGSKGFETVITRLQMECYVVTADFEYARDRWGKPYGWGQARLSTPEQLLGEDFMREAYREEPARSRERVYEHLLKTVPGATEKDVARLLGEKR